MIFTAGISIVHVVWFILVKSLWGEKTRQRGLLPALPAARGSHP